MTPAAFVFFYLLATLLAIQKPILIVWVVGIYSAIIMHNIWTSSRHR